MVEERQDWRWWTTPKLLAGKPIHRWYVFPHSFTNELVHALIDEWELTYEDHILDPFAGAGTTLLAAKEKGIPSTGYDLSPLAVLAAQVKIANYDVDRLNNLWLQLRRSIQMSPVVPRSPLWSPVYGGQRGTLSPVAPCCPSAKDYPDLVRRALPGKLLGAFDAMDRSIVGLDATQAERDFFRLALLATIPEYSRAVAEGGWLRWVDRRRGTSTLLDDFAKHVTLMLEDVQKAPCPPAPCGPPASPACGGQQGATGDYAPCGPPYTGDNACQVRMADARSLPDADSTYSAVITSPPYPNRHDYTRIFGVELMFGFLDWKQTRQLRYQSFHSHPEARPVRPDVHGYTQPAGLARAIADIARKERNPRVKGMLEGYFIDMYLVLREVRRVCRRGARIAFVVGNAQYQGVPIAVDEFTAEIGEQVGLKCKKLLVARYRGNSAQQMGKYGRKPARETVVVFQKA